MLRYHEIATDERRVLSLTSLTPTEFTALVSPFKNAFDEYLEEQTVDGYERVGRRYVPYRNSLLPTIEDKLLFILVYLKQAPTQEVQASLFGMRQPKANMWIHLLHAVLNRTLRQNGDLPRRDILIELADITSEEQNTTLEEDKVSNLRTESPAKAPPLFFTMEQSDR